VALLIAALSAEGKSIIQNIEQIDRGYQHIDESCAGWGLKSTEYEYGSEDHYYNGSFRGGKNFHYPVPAGEIFPVDLFYFGCYRAPRSH